MVSRYKIGYYYERKVKSILERDEWDVWRSPASHSPVDIIAIKPYNNFTKVKLIQVKRISKESIKEEYFKYDIERLKELAKRYDKCKNIEIELWVFKKNSSRPHIIRITS